MWAASAETLMAALFLRSGLQSLDLHNREDFYPAALHLLGQGFEHLLKLTFAFAQLRTRETIGLPDDMKRIGHDLPTLRDQLVKQPMVQLWLRGDGWEGPLMPLTRIRTLRRLPKEWRSDS